MNKSGILDKIKSFIVFIMSISLWYMNAFGMKKAGCTIGYFSNLIHDEVDCLYARFVKIKI